MLALSRYLNEEVIITAPGGYTIRVVVLGTEYRKGRRRVKLGFDAPQGVRINRLEVQLANERVAATATAATATKDDPSPVAGAICVICHRTPVKQAGFACSDCY